MLILDSNLTYNEHIITTVSACMKRLGQINRVKHAFDQRTLTIIINSLVFSKLFYCSNVWSNTTERNLDKLQAVQNFACRIISGARKFDHITPILKRLQWFPVRDQLYYRQAIMCFKCMTGSAPGYLTEQFIKRSDVSKRSLLETHKLLISHYLDLLVDRKPFIIRLLVFGTLWHPNLNFANLRENLNNPWSVYF